MEKGKPIRNVGIFAHVDAGKTTTTEHMLYLSGRTTKLGSVDHGTAQTDSLEIERQRGISVRSAVTRFPWKDVTLHLIDTPGHIDFISEVERSLRVLDGAILMISAVEGIQAQTEMVWQALRSLHVPTLIYVNKMDRVGAHPDRVIDEIQRVLSKSALPVQAPIGLEASFLELIDLLDRDERIEHPYKVKLMEAIAERDDTLLNHYFEEGMLSTTQMVPFFKKLVRHSEAFPICFGASAKGVGVSELLDAVVRFLPEPSGSDNAPLSGLVFKLERDEQMGRMAYVRLFDGALQNRSSVYNHTLGLEEKVTQIRWVEGKKSEDLGALKAGEMAVIYGLSHVRIGDILGSTDRVPGEETLAVPLLTVQVFWETEADYPKVIAAFQELTDEDPQLNMQWLKESRELHLKIMGQIQMEILTHLVLERYGLRITFGEPSVIYKETPCKPGEGLVVYTMPKPCWAVLRFHLEPLEAGEGVVFASTVRPEDLLERYQNEVKRRIPEVLEQGLKGWEVTDLKITLIEGEHHVLHTHPLDFAVATPMGIMDGLKNTGTKLLEPILNFRLSIPEEVGGKVMNELTLMRGTFDSPVLVEGRMEIKGALPVATSLDFPRRLASLTKGRGTLTSSFKGYQESPPDVVAERKRQGVNPLDQAKFILAARKAL
ncbi:MAG TPA: translation factor GTPase family protein [Sporolactobacillaceae bacterium]|nr:translation factor GTPase family protein [Sporolactobacillaceae bacterium]